MDRPAGARRHGGGSDTAPASGSPRLRGDTALLAEDFLSDWRLHSHLSGFLLGNGV